MNVHQDRVPCAHSALNEVLLALIPHFVKLSKSLDLSGLNPLFAPFAFGLLVVPVRHTAFCKQHRCLKEGLLPACGNDRRIKHMLFGEIPELTMSFRHKAPRFFRLNSFQQLHADAIHLRGMQQISFFLARVLEGNHSRVKVVMAGLAQCQKIALLIASMLAPKNDVMHFEAALFGFPLAVLTGVTIPCQHIGFGIGISLVDALLIKPLLLQHLWFFERMWVKGSGFQHYGCDWQ